MIQVDPDVNASEFNRIVYREVEKAHLIWPHIEICFPTSYWHTRRGLRDDEVLIRCLGRMASKITVKSTSKLKWLYIPKSEAPTNGQTSNGKGPSNITT